MAIVAIISSLGALGLNSFRETSLLQQANADFIASFKSIQNAARNSSISQRLLANTNNVLLSRPAGWGIFFENGGGYSLRYCTTQVVTGVTQYNCSNYEYPSLKSSTFNEVTVTSSVKPKCTGILFISGTSDIAAMSSSVAAPDNTGTCTINTYMTGSGADFRDIVIDLNENNLQI
jgi:hypothetical protein